jgi:hypothetical protein
MYITTENAIRVSAAVLFLGKSPSHNLVGICLTNLIYILVMKFTPMIVSALEDFLAVSNEFQVRFLTIRQSAAFIPLR